MLLQSYLDASGRRQSRIHVVDSAGTMNFEQEKTERTEQEIRGIIREQLNRHPAKRARFTQIV